MEYSIFSAWTEWRTGYDKDTRGYNRNEFVKDGFKVDHSCCNRFQDDEGNLLFDNTDGSKVKHCFPATFVPEELRNGQTWGYVGDKPYDSTGTGFICGDCCDYENAQRFASYQDHTSTHKKANGDNCLKFGPNGANPQCRPAVNQVYDANQDAQAVGNGVSDGATARCKSVRCKDWNHKPGVTGRLAGHISFAGCSRNLKRCMSEKHPYVRYYKEQNNWFKTCDGVSEVSRWTRECRHFGELDFQPGFFTEFKVGVTTATDPASQTKSASRTLFGEENSPAGDCKGDSVRINQDCPMWTEWQVDIDKCAHSYDDERWNRVEQFLIPHGNCGRRSSGTRLGTNPPCPVCPPNDEVCPNCPADNCRPPVAGMVDALPGCCFTVRKNGMFSQGVRFIVTDTFLNILNEILNVVVGLLTGGTKPDMNFLDPTHVEFGDAKNTGYRVPKYAEFLHRDPGFSGSNDDDTSYMCNEWDNYTEFRWCYIGARDGTQNDRCVAEIPGISSTDGTFARNEERIKAWFHSAGNPKGLKVNMDRPSRTSNPIYNPYMVSSCKSVFNSRSTCSDPTGDSGSAFTGHNSQTNRKHKGRSGCKAQRWCDPESRDPSKDLGTSPFKEIKYSNLERWVGNFFWNWDRRHDFTPSDPKYRRWGVDQRITKQQCGVTAENAFDCYFADEYCNLEWARWLAIIIAIGVAVAIHAAIPLFG